MSDYNNYIHHAIKPLVDVLLKRYPGVRIVEACYTRDHWGTLQQYVHYQAPLEHLQRLGLVTEAMLERHKHRRSWRGAITEHGDVYSLHERIDQRSVAGCWDLSIMTGTIAACDRDRIGVRQAAQLLRRIARSARRREGAA